MTDRVDAAPTTTAARAAHLADMIRVRVLEEECAQLYGQTKIRGFLHLYIGEEAVATGVMAGLTESDAVFATYREHGHALLRGVPAREIMAEMFGRATGCSGGRGGSMHLFDIDRGFYGGNAIVGGHLPLAAGMALSQQFAGGDALTACFFGEGAMAEGEFHETANLATLWNLPLLLCCENNLYAMGTSLESSESQTNLVQKAASYGMTAREVDGMDVDAVRQATEDAVAAIRRGEGPVFLEFRTFRFRAHSMFDPDRYREKEEIDRWRERDPIVLMTERLLAEGAITAETVREYESAAANEVADAVAFADAAPLEPIEDLTRHVYRRTLP